MKKLLQITCVGDSLTRGYLDPTTGYPAQLANALAANYEVTGIVATSALPRVVNRGNNGSTISGLPTVMVDTDIKAGARNVLLVQIGTNDLRVPGATADLVFLQLLDYVRARQLAGWEVRVLTPPRFEKNDGTQASAQAQLRLYVETIAASLDGAVDDSANPYIGINADTSSPLYYLVDHVHLTPKGYGEIAKAVRKALRTRGGSIVLPPPLVVPFSPLSLATLEAWYEASMGVSVDGSNNVSAWNDSSLTGDLAKNLFQATPAKRPAYTAEDVSYNRRPSVSFLTANDNKLAGSGAWATALAQPATYFVAGDLVSAGLISGTAAARQEIGWAGVAAYAYAGALLNGVTGGAGQPAVYCIVFNGITSAIYRSDMTTPLGTGDAGTQSQPQIVLGNLADFDGPATGVLVEAFAMSGVVDAVTRVQAGEYLKKKYAL